MSAFILALTMMVSLAGTFIIAGLLYAWVINKLKGLAWRLFT